LVVAPQLLSLSAYEFRCEGICKDIWVQPSVVSSVNTFQVEAKDLGKIEVFTILEEDLEFGVVIEVIVRFRGHLFYHDISFNDKGIGEETDVPKFAVLCDE